MKVLWVINVALPEASRMMNEQPLPFGGWLDHAARRLAQREEIDLSIAFPSFNGKTLTILEGEKVQYYPFIPVQEGDAKTIKFNKSFAAMVQRTMPDIVHIHGTEYAHSLSMVNTCQQLNVPIILSIQGLVSVIEKHTYAGLPFRAVYGSTLRNLLRKDNVKGLRKGFFEKGKNEKKALEKAQHIIGRTTWDRACSRQINPGATYHFCNETLREEFYNHRWELENCRRFSIFLSQGQYPVKGLHFMLEALELILKRFPETVVYIGGKDITKSESYRDKLLMTYYGRYIKEIINKSGLEENVVFTGLLDEKAICRQFLKSHVFVCPSSVENSSNSLGEAMLLGVPCVASYVGGLPDLLEDKKEGFLYPYDAPYMLAHYICEVFDNQELALKISANARKRALKTHDRIENSNRLIEIYNNVLQNFS